MSNRNTKKIHVTSHAKDRIKERLGVNKKSSKKVTKIALEKGLNIDELTGPLLKFAEQKISANNNAVNNVAVYNEKLFLFENKRLVTVIPLGLKLKKIAQKLLQRKYESKKSNQES